MVLITTLIRGGFMDFNDDIIKKLVKEVTLTEEINLSDIPCVDLYMDQVTTFFEGKLNSLKRDKEDKILTKTMINNYTKAKILMPVKNKKYTKQHIILLTLIYNLKQTMSISDICTIISPLLKETDKSLNNAVQVDKLYSAFLDIKSQGAASFEEQFTMELKSIKVKYADDELEQMLLTVLMLINEANIHKRMAEKILDNFLVNKKKI